MAGLKPLYLFLRVSCGSYSPSETPATSVDGDMEISRLGALSGVVLAQNRRLMLEAEDDRCSD